MKLNTNIVLLGLIGVLVLMAGLQAFQLATLSQALSSGTISTSTSGAQSSVLSQLGQASQVGGC
mgnify:FL=1